VFVRQCEAEEVDYAHQGGFVGTSDFPIVAVPREHLPSLFVQGTAALTLLLPIDCPPGICIRNQIREGLDGLKIGQPLPNDLNNGEFKPHSACPVPGMFPRGFNLIAVHFASSRTKNDGRSGRRDWSLPHELPAKIRPSR
jgi:hypothetical protein